MKKFLIIFIVSLFSVQLLSAQQNIFSDKMELVEYELTELYVDSLFLHYLDSLIFNSVCPDLKNEKYQYFRIHIDTDEKNETQIWIELHKFPGRKQDNSFGYFEYKNYTFFVMGENPDNIFCRGAKKKTFSYKDYLKGSIFTLEDEVPTWIFEYKDGKLFLKYPN